jgi:LysM repeat protein
MSPFTCARRLLPTVVVVAAGALVSPIATSDVSAAPRTCGAPGRPTHTVADGETWYGIARSAGVSTTSLYAANHADEDTVIHPGDVLCLPAGAPTPAPSPSTAVVVDGACPASAPATYTVEPGDSWSTIAKRAGLSLTGLLHANDAKASTVIHPGDSLCVPAGTSMPAAPARASSRRGAGGMQALPVQGPCWYADSWQAPRGNGRRHEGVDLITSAGNYIYAVTDGTLTRRAWDRPGSLSGNAWWLTSDDGSGTYYFYAHLSAFAPGLAPG